VTLTWQTAKGVVVDIFWLGEGERKIKATRSNYGRFVGQLQQATVTVGMLLDFYTKDDSCFRRLGNEVTNTSALDRHKFRHRTCFFAFLINVSPDSLLWAEAPRIFDQARAQLLAGVDQAREERTDGPT
jgi:hypothetical protein